MINMFLFFYKILTNHKQKNIFFIENVLTLQLLLSSISDSNYDNFSKKRYPLQSF